ncbi:MAG: DUF4157 domain-containing protein [Xenococcaceae cyanobacterium MO_188.B29]|nr:DUF4157 domain-containing protein [Xenococcaceae cyanobacterium MO_188.B29]
MATHTHTQKPSSSWTPAATKIKGFTGPHPFPDLVKPNSQSVSSKEIPAYSSKAFDRLNANVMDTLQAKAQEEANLRPIPEKGKEDLDSSHATELGQGESEFWQRITRQAVKASVPNVQADFETFLNRARGGGSPLDNAFRAKVEPAMGEDFGGVKVHTNAEADRLSQSIQAKAFTTGQDIFFRQGEYNPGSQQGKELLAHESTHVVQQEGKQSAILPINEKFLQFQQDRPPSRWTPEGKPAKPKSLPNQLYRIIGPQRRRNIPIKQLLSKVEPLLKDKSKAELQSIEKNYNHLYGWFMIVSNEDTPYECWHLEKKGQPLSRQSPLRKDLENALKGNAQGFIDTLEKATRLKPLSKKEFASSLLSPNQRKMAISRSKGNRRVLANWLFEEKTWIYLVANVSEWAPHKEMGFFELPGKMEKRDWSQTVGDWREGDKKYLSRIERNIEQVIKTIRDGQASLMKLRATGATAADVEGLKRIIGTVLLGYRNKLRLLRKKTNPFLEKLIPIKFIWQRKTPKNSNELLPSVQRKSIDGMLAKLHLNASIQTVEDIGQQLPQVIQQTLETSVQPNIKVTATGDLHEHNTELIVENLSTQEQVLTSQIERVQSSAGIIQRDAPPPGPEMITRPLPDARVGINLVSKIFILGPQGDLYLRQMREYIQNTLRVPAAEVMLVGGVREIFQHLLGLERNIRVTRLIIVAHGSRGRQAALGGRGGQVRGQQGWIRPQDVMTFARRDPLAARVRRDVMANDAMVEFWGCNIGSDVAASGAWSTAFGRRFRAQTGRMETGTHKYYRPVRRGTPGAQRVRGQRGWWRRVTNLGEVPAGLQQHFRTWLLRLYLELAATGEIRETRPPRNEERRFQYMRSLFDRSRGVIRFMKITERTSGRTFRPRQQGWLDLWQTEPFNPLRLTD